MMRVNLVKSKRLLLSKKGGVVSNLWIATMIGILMFAVIFTCMSVYISTAHIKTSSVSAMNNVISETISTEYNAFREVQTITFDSDGDKELKADKFNEKIKEVLFLDNSGKKIVNGKLQYQIMPIDSSNITVTGGDGNQHFVTYKVVLSVRIPLPYIFGELGGIISLDAPFKSHVSYRESK
ncbi:MAG: hypothetical protein LBD17_03105 [Endomicrobium sp.]|nr:hypothetical protein [Endomicrobium sp.]